MIACCVRVHRRDGGGGGGGSGVRRLVHRCLPLQGAIVDL